MATIYHPLSGNNLPNETGLFSLPRTYVRDRSAGVALAGLGNLFDQAISGVDTLNQQDIKNQARSELEPLRDAEINRNLQTLSGPQPVQQSPVDESGFISGFGAAPDLTPTLTPDIQNSLGQATSELDKASTARLAGKMNPLLFDLKAMAVTSRLRSKYPGYADYIDDAVSGVIGHNPANKALAETQALITASAAQHNSAAEKSLTWARNHMEDLGPAGYANYRAAIAAGDETAKLRIEMFVAERQANRQLITDAQQKARLSQTNAELNQTTALTYYDQMARGTFNDIITRTNAGLTKFGAQNLNDAINKLSDNPNPENVVAITQLIRGLRQEFQTKMVNLSAVPMGNGNSISSVIHDSGKISSIDNFYLKLFDGMEQALGSKNYNLLHHYATLAQGLKDAATYHVLKDAPITQIIAGVQGAAPNSDVSGILLGQTQVMQKLGIQLNALITKQALDLQTRNPNDVSSQNLRDMYQEYVTGAPGATDEQRVAASKISTEVLKGMLTKGTPQQRAVAAKVLSSSKSADYVKMFTPAQQIDVWAYVSSPEVIKNIVGTPGAKEYFAWNRQVSRELFADYAATIQKQGIENFPRMNIRFNPETMQIDYDHSKALPHTGASDRANPVAIAIDRYNKYLGVNKNIAEAMGLDPKTFLLQTMRDSGIDFSKARQVPRSLFDVIGDWYNKTFNQDEPNLFKDTPQDGSKSLQDGRRSDSSSGRVQLASLQQNAPAANSERLNYASEGGLENLPSEITQGHSAGRYSEVGNFVARGAGKVDPRLREVLRQAAAESGMTVQAYSGYRPGDPRFHGHGEAVDVRLIDKNGKEIPNYQSPENFGVYERFAKAVRRIQQEKYPELDNALRWGGYFSGGPDRYGAMDLMHFDLGGEHVGMAGGSWDKGLTAAQRRIWGIPKTSAQAQRLLSAESGEGLDNLAGIMEVANKVGKDFDWSSFRPSDNVIDTREKDVQSFAKLTAPEATPEDFDTFVKDYGPVVAYNVIVKAVNDGKKLSKAVIRKMNAVIRSTPKEEFDRLMYGEGGGLQYDPNSETDPLAIQAGIQDIPGINPERVPLPRKRPRKSSKTAKKS